MSNTAPTLPLATGIKSVHIIVQTNMNLLTSLLPIQGDCNHHLQGIESFFEKLDVGVFRSNTYVAINSTYASDLVTFSSIANGDTVTVNGRIYTAETSGATGLQQFNIGGSDTAAMANFIKILNADTSTLVKGVVTATPAATPNNTCTLICLVPGNIGLQMTAAISAHGTVASANFTGGLEGTNGTGGHGL